LEGTLRSLRLIDRVDLAVSLVAESVMEWLTAQARGELDKVAAALKDPSIAQYPLIIAGHTDGVGGAEYNQRLSERRAESARQYFPDRTPTAPRPPPTATARNSG
jgi:OmpA family